MKPLFVLCFIFFCAVINTQHSQAQGFEGKAIAGFSASQVDGDQTWGYNLVRPLAGLGGGFYLGKRTEIQLEIIYNIKGAGAARNQPYINSRLTYVDMPVLLNYFWDKKRRIVMQVGISVNYLLRARIDFTGWEYKDYTDKLSRLDYAFTAGAEYRFDDRWAINARYSYSFVPINFVDSNFLFTSAWFNNYIGFSIRYNFINPAKNK